MHVDAVLAQVFRQIIDQFAIKSTQQLLAAHEHFHPAAQRLQHGCQFNGDVTTTDYRHTLRCIAQVEEIIRHHAQFRAGNVRALWLATRCDKHLRRSDAKTLVGFNCVCIHEMSATRQVHDAGGIQSFAVAVVDAGDVALAMDNELLPVQRGRLQIESEARSQIDALRQVRCQPHRFLRHAAHVDTGAAELARFQQDYPGAMRSSSECTGQSTRATPDHGQIVVVGGGGIHRKRSRR